MTAACTLCGQIITGREAGVIGGTEEHAQALDLHNFDLLAAAVLHHLSLNHQNETGQQMTAIAHLAAKVYAMTLATSHVNNFRALSKAWRMAIVTELARDPYQAEAAAAAPDDAGVGNSSAPSGSESNEMKSPRKVST